MTQKHVFIKKYFYCWGRASRTGVSYPAPLCAWDRTCSCQVWGTATNTCIIPFTVPHPGYREGAAPSLPRIMCRQEILHTHRGVPQTDNADNNLPRPHPRQRRTVLTESLKHHTPALFSQGSRFTMLYCRATAPVTQGSLLHTSLKGWLHHINRPLTIQGVGQSSLPSTEA